MANPAEVMNGYDLVCPIALSTGNFKFHYKLGLVVEESLVNSKKQITHCPRRSSERISKPRLKQVQEENAIVYDVKGILEDSEGKL